MNTFPRVKSHIIEFMPKGVPCTFKPRTVTRFQPGAMQVPFRPMFFSHSANSEGALEALLASGLRIGKYEQFVCGDLPLKFLLECPHWDLMTMPPDTGLTFSVWNPSAVVYTATDLQLHGVIPE